MSIVKHGHRIAWPLDVLASDDRFDRAFRDLAHDYLAGDAMPILTSPTRSRHMRVEEYVEGDTCVIRAELPGLDPDKDIEITVADQLLHISAHREERTEEERPEGFRSEFHYGSFQRSIQLPDGATGEDVTATYLDGVLEVRVPMPGVVQSSPTHIPVTRG